MRVNMTIKSSVLIQQLKNADDESARFNESSYDLELSEGVRYLYYSVLLPLLKGEKLSTSDLDMNSFDRDDIEELYSFYMNNFTCLSREFSALQRICQKCSCSSALTENICFL